VSRVRGLHGYILFAAAALALIYADRLNPYWMHVAIIAMYYGILASSWSLLAGYVGLFSLGHTAFASIGGYASALLTKWFAIPIPLSMVAGIAVCCALGAGIGWVCLRMSGPYLAIFTLGFSEIVRIAISTEDDVTAGMAGLHTPPLFSSATRRPYFYVAFALLAVSLALMGLLVRSRWGLFLRAIREDERAAAASGVAVARFRILAFAIASGFAGLAGGFYAHYVGIMTPSVGDLDEMAKLVVMTVIGGMERLPTAVGGAFVVQVLLEFLREYGQWRLPLFGVILLLTMRFARNGLLTPLWLQFVRLGEPRVSPVSAVRDAPQKDPAG
jgi:branched-chain amino acid transport system permease protein